MGIEMRGADNAPPPAAKSHTAARPQEHAGSAKDGAETSPFLALMAALEPQAVPADAPDDTATAVVDPSADPLAMAGQQPPPLDAASLLAQGLATGGKAAPYAEATPAEGRDVVPKGRAAGVAGLAADAKSRAASLSTEVAAAREPAAADDAPVANTHKGRLSASAALAQAAQDTSTARAGETHAKDVRQSGEILGADWKNTLSGQSGSATAAGAAFAEGLVLQKGLLAPRSSERQAARPGAPVSGAVLSAGSADQAVSGNGAAAAPTPVLTLEGTGANATATLADKLNYWVSRGVQNAELQLDAFGGGTVDVSIALHGRDAQVEFRSDVPEARRMLQDAMPQLKEMFKGEGLVLSGGFVGTSAQGDSGPQERRSPSPGARSAVVRMEPPQAGALPGMGGAAGRATGRTVDLFV